MNSPSAQPSAVCSCPHYIHYLSDLRTKKNRRTIKLMSEGLAKQFPYRTLGYQLHSLREKKNQTLIEVSGAVEIDAESLLNIERGSVLPSEDILLLLISYFGLQNEAALKLWKLAGYDKLLDASQPDSDFLSQQSAVLLLPIDARIIYSDSVQIKKNDHGIVMNFMQSGGQNGGQPTPISRVGMSREHAQNVINLLQKVLSNLDATKQLSQKNPKNKTTSKKTDKDK